MARRSDRQAKQRGLSGLIAVGYGNRRQRECAGFTGDEFNPVSFFDFPNARDAKSRLRGL